MWQKQELTVAEAKLLTVNGEGGEGKDNGPSDVALLQASMSQLTSNSEELKNKCGQKDAEIASLRSQLDKAQADFQHLVSEQTDT
jgi:peptidoglycan hydrolase CwlO-like protein